MSVTTATATAAKSESGSRRKARLLTVAAAVAAAVIVWGIAELAGMHLRQPGFGSRATTPLNAGFVIGVSLIASLAGWALLAGLEHATTRARGIWTTVAVVFVLLSLGGPFSGHGVSTGNRLVLGLIHLLVAAIVITGLPRAGTSAR
ncbi:MAG TPA: DUF6069 family protein [Streptosporangiaceae bacterium]|jgi:hypothetical protein